MGLGCGSVEGCSFVLWGENGRIPSGAEKVLEWVEKAFQSDILQRARTSGKVFRELPVTGKQADGTYLNAIIDLAFLEDGLGSWWITRPTRTTKGGWKPIENRSVIIMGF